MVRNIEIYTAIVLKILNITVTTEISLFITI